MYLITFHSQFDSNIFKRSMTQYGKVKQKPVPRNLSSSCGTCCEFEPDSTRSISDLIRDMSFERVFVIGENDTFTLLFEKE